MADDLRLLQRAKALDEAALAEIHERYYTSIYQYIAFRINDLQTVEDLTSEVFLRLLRAIRDKNAPQDTLRGWLYGVASHVVKEHYRKMKRMNFAPLEDELMSNDERVEDQIQNKLVWEAIRSVLGELTEEQQHVLALRFGFGMRAATQQYQSLANRAHGKLLRRIASDRLRPFQNRHKGLACDVGRVSDRKAPQSPTSFESTPWRRVSTGWVGTNHELAELASVFLRPQDRNRRG